MNLIDTYSIIRKRDNMALDELKQITKDCKVKYGRVDFKNILLTMGYKPAFNNYWYDV